MDYVAIEVEANLAEYAVMYGYTYETAYLMAKWGNYHMMLADIHRGVPQ